MLISDIPAKFNIAFATSAGGGFIRPVPQASQIGIQTGAASLTDGFPPACFTPVGAGGVPPFGQDMNGILNQATAWCRWVSAGAPMPWDSAFSAAVGGYPAGSIVSAIQLGYLWYCTVDANTSNPETGGSGWILFSPYAITTGQWQWRPTQETLPGWVKGNGTTIGSAASGATQLASAEALNLFKWFWTNFSNSLCPVSGGRGANAAADFAANKTIGTLNMQGASIIGMDTMGGSPSTWLNNVPVTSGSGTQAGSFLGENLHSLIIAELAAHDHNYADPGHIHTASTNAQSLVVAGASGGVVLVGSGSPATVTVNSHATGITFNSQGSGTGHNTVERTVTGTHYFKL